jgi:O-antigen ligase
MHARSLPSLTIGAGTLASLLVALAMGASSIVFSEPAVADALMAVVIFAIPVLGAQRLGLTAHTHLILWLFIVGFGLAGSSMSTNLDTGIKHQLVTLFLALGSFVLAGYIAADAAPRFRLVMTFYLVGCLVATLAAFIGYFGIVPSTYELFTNYGRARGTFKDPNVLGAALAPGVVYCLWLMLRNPPRTAMLAGTVAMFLGLGLLITFSRGAWMSAVFSSVLAAWLLLVTSRRQVEFKRFIVMSALGTIGMVVAVIGILQIDSVSALLTERATLDQSYDSGPEGRFGGQAKAMGLILEHPFGIGTHTFRDTYHPEEAHNIYLSTFMNAGWLGGLLYVISVTATVFAGFRGVMRATPLQGPFIVVTAAFTGLVLEGFVIDTDHWRHFFILMGCIWGLADARVPAFSSFGAPPRS